MLINRVVVNASPLICLFKSGLEDLFPSLFNDIVVPEAVIKLSAEVSSLHYSQVFGSGIGNSVTIKALNK
jgi:predicted nucleic acid-binding protein